MKWIKKLFTFFKKQNKNQSLIEANNQDNKNKSEFLDYIKVNNKKRKPSINTLVCTGDGLGIDNKIEY